MVGFWRASRARRSVPARCAFLALWVLALAAPLIPLAYRLSGVPGAVAAASGALVCYVGAALALLLTDRLRGPDLAAFALLIGMLCRTGLPLVTALVIHLRTKAFIEAGLRTSSRNAKSADGQKANQKPRITQHQASPAKDAGAPQRRDESGSSPGGVTT